MYKFKIVKVIILMVLLVIPIALLILPSDFFDNGESICPSKRFLDIECLGCGLTRAVMHLIHLDFSTAWAFNKMSYVVVPLGIFYWGKNLKKVIEDLKKEI